MEKFFVNRPIFAIALAVAIVLLGGISILNLSIEQYPDCLLYTSPRPRDTR